MMPMSKSTGLKKQEMFTCIKPMNNVQYKSVFAQ